MIQKRLSHYTCGNLRDLGGQESWSKKRCRNLTKIAPKSSFGHSGVQFLRFWEGLIEVRFLMNFWAAPKMKQIWKNEAEVWKERFRGKGQRQRRGPRRAFGVCKSVRSVRVCNWSGTPCPLRAAGGGGSMGYRLFRRPLFFALCVWSFKLWAGGFVFGF